MWWLLRSFWWSIKFSVQGKVPYSLCLLYCRVQIVETFQIKVKKDIKIPDERVFEGTFEISSIQVCIGDPLVFLRICIFLFEILHFCTKNCTEYRNTSKYLENMSGHYAMILKFSFSKKTKLLQEPTKKEIMDSMSCWWLEIT